MEKLSEKEIRQKLNNNEKFTFVILESINSTNTEAKNLACKNAAENTVVLAEHQTAGKGRMNRKFSSPEGTGIYMSLILKPKLSAENAVMITTAAAVAVSQAIESVANVKTGIKWVNDIYIGDKKVCGILAESASSSLNSDFKYVILGIGVNVFEPTDGFPDEIKEIAGAIYKNNHKIHKARNLLVAEILNRFEEIYSNLPKTKYMDYYKEKSILTGKEVQILKAGEVCGEATVEGINDCGELVVKYKNGITESLSSGEVSVKKKVTNE